MKKLFFLGIIGIVWSCSSQKKIAAHGRSACADSARQVRNFSHIGGFMSSVNGPYDVFIGSTLSSSYVLRITKQKDPYDCILLGAGNLSYEVAYFSDPDFKFGGMVFYFSFKTDVRAIDPDTLVRYSKDTMDERGIKTLTVEFK